MTDLVNTTNLVQKYLSKQMDIDKILDVIKRKVLKGTHLPLTIKEIQAGYLTCLHFKDIYKYLAQTSYQEKGVQDKRWKTYQIDMSCWIHCYLK